MSAGLKTMSERTRDWHWDCCIQPRFRKLIEGGFKVGSSCNKAEMAYWAAFRQGRSLKRLKRRWDKAMEALRAHNRRYDRFAERWFGGQQAFSQWLSARVVYPLF